MPVADTSACSTRGRLGRSLRGRLRRLPRRSFLDYIVVPKNAKSGTHELKVIVEDYANLHQEVSASFSILKSINQLTVYFFILLGAVVLVGGLVFAQIRMERRQRSS